MKYSVKISDSKQKKTKYGKIPQNTKNICCASGVK